MRYGIYTQWGERVHFNAECCDILCGGWLFAALLGLSCIKIWILLVNPGLVYKVQRQRRNQSSVFTLRRLNEKWSRGWHFGYKIVELLLLFPFYKTTPSWSCQLSWLYTYILLKKFQLFQISTLLINFAIFAMKTSKKNCKTGQSKWVHVLFVYTIRMGF